MIVLLAVVALGCTPLADSDTTTSPAAGSSTSSSIPVIANPSTISSTTTTTTVFEPIDTHLLVVGDWGSGTLPQGAVAGTMARYAAANDIEAILTTGDNFYSDDAEFLMRPFGWVAEAGIPFWFTWGNHDVESDSRIQIVEETFGSPPRWTVHTWGAVDIVILDSNQVTSFEQAAFFLDAMASSSGPMIVALHHPPYSCSHHGPTVEVVDQFVSFLDEDVVLVLAGHEHSYQRFNNKGVTYVVTGGGGRALRPLTNCPANHPERLAGAELYHFVSLEQSDDAVVLTAYDVNGEVIDEVSIPLP